MNERPATGRRTRLAELDQYIHCSVIGTCLSTAELRKLVSRFSNVDRERASDLQVHNAAVELVSLGGEGAKAIHKALDRRYAQALKRIGLAKDVDALRSLWDEALKSGDVPPAYWAIMTHPASTDEIRALMFGEVHMLSHLVGAANRADIRRLVALEEENAALKSKTDRQQSRLHALATEYNATVRELKDTIDTLNTQLNERPGHAAEELQTELAQLRMALVERDQSIALHASRCKAVEDRFNADRIRMKTLRDQLDEARDIIESMKNEARAMEESVVRSAGGSTDMRPALERVAGKRIVYVGGRPGSNAVIKQLVELAGGWLSAHDGGVEDRKGLLATLIPGADLVVFPVDCIDHDSMNTLKRICDRHTVPYRPLRTASVASFVALMAHDSLEHSQSHRCGTASPICLRHG